MTTRNAADRYLKCRNGKWQYYRRVPKEFAEHDNRGTIRVSLKTDSLTMARAKRDALAEADEQLWMTLASAKGSIARLLDPATSQILKRYEAARHRAMSKDYIYTPADQLAETANLEEIVSRLLEVAKQPENEKKEAEALLGGVNRPKIPVSKAFEIYCEKIALSDTVRKSPAQIKAWRKAKKRAVNNFIKICGDLSMNEIERRHGQAFYDWWGKRLIPDPSGKAMAPNTANRDIGNMKKLFREYWAFEGEEERENPFRNLRYSDKQIEKVPHFENEWVREKMLNPTVFSGLNPQAVLICYALIETGCRPSEIANLKPENIILSGDTPHIKIRATNDRELKTSSSVREIPLVGVSLEAMKKAPQGFPHYHDKNNLLSITLHKGFRARKLFPTPKHKIYSFRHSFEKRMLEGGIDYGLRCDLMGHSNTRPDYGDGGSLSYRRNELEKIAHPMPYEFRMALPEAY